MPSNSARSDLAILGIAAGIGRMDEPETAFSAATPPSLSQPQLPAEVLDPHGAVGRPLSRLRLRIGLGCRGLGWMLGLAALAAAILIDPFLQILILPAAGFWSFSYFLERSLPRQAHQKAAKEHRAAMQGYRMEIAQPAARLARHREALDRAHRLLYALPELYRRERDSGEADLALDRRFRDRRAALEGKVRDEGELARIAAGQAWVVHERRLARLRQTAAALAQARADMLANGWLPPPTPNL